jgi:hypothetical protein
MLTGFETKNVIVRAGDATMRPQAPVTVVGGDGSPIIVGCAEAGVDETIDVAITGVYPSTTKVRQTGRRFPI